MTEIFSMITLIAMVGLSITVGIISYKAIHGQPSLPFIKAALVFLAAILISAAIIFGQGST